MKKRLFNKRGMTYVELLVALALLALIVVSFTPMLVSSYDTLYKAGEKTEEVYRSQEEMEDGLAVRSSTKKGSVQISFSMNAANVFEKMNVNGRKIVSTFQDSLETMFYGVRARVDILTPDTVYDDTTTHEIILQTTGIPFTDIKKRSDYSGDLEDLPDNTILIDAFIPEKAASISYGTVLEENVYKNSRATITNMKADTSTGRINFTLGGADFTKSPIKFVIYYKNERGITKQVQDYLYIEPTRLLMAGTTKYNDYYTSAGVQQLDDSTGETQVVKYEFTLEGRTMNLKNSGLFAENETPKNKGVTFKTIAWVPNDSNPNLAPYYVMAGTNASVYRMYVMNTEKSLKEAMGAKNDVAGTTDGVYVITTGEKVMPSFWSGEMSDQYSFQTLFKASTYGNAEDNKIDCSAPYSGDNISGPSYVGTQYNKIDKNLRYMMHFAGYRCGYEYSSQQSRKISYTLTEAGTKSFRIAGKKRDEGDFTGYHTPWEYEYTKFEGGLLSANTSDEKAIYLGGAGALAATNSATDKHLGYLKLNVYTNINPFDAAKDSTDYGTGETIAFRFTDGGDFWSPPGKSEESYKNMDWKNRESYINTKYACNVNITSAVYLPGSGYANGQTAGQVIYFGTVPAYALVRQSSDIVEKQEKVYNTKNVVGSAATMYLICGSQGEGTTIYRNSYSGSDGANRTENVDAQNLMRKHLNSGSTSLQTSAQVFYTTKGDSITYKHPDADLEFTLGYCSRWRMAIGDVTFNGSKEETKSYEHFYTASHSSANYQRKPGINAGTTDNLYYNVWFPGEFYNLTTTATCDEVTVAVGYTVSGSTYMSESWVVGSGYYGTALGSIYNDGVLAAYTQNGTKITAGLSGKGEQNVIFKNLLYYKSPSYINSTLHSRANVRFERVGLNCETTKTSDTSGTKKYYAYFSDNSGNVYKAHVATANVTSSGSGESTSATESTTLHTVADTALTKIQVNGQDMNQIFSDIVSIVAKEEIIIITGSPKAGQGNTIVVATKDGSGNWVWKKVSILPEFKSNNFPITSACEVAGYFYIGVNAGATDGYVCAINMETLRAAGNGSILHSGGYDGNTNTSSSANPDHVLYVRAGDQIYAIAGRDAR
ncbi:MAG: hypothetical protein J6Q83_03295 [Clostridia bacterium]|nr:hypothetical protein [Clostridia bacterium]